MSTNHHTPLPFGGPLTAAAMEAPLGQLDAAIAAVIATGSGTSTTLTAQANAGQATLVVASSAGFAPGDPIYLGSGATFESRIILAVPDATHITVSVNLTNTYAIGKPVSKSPVELVDARSGSTTLKGRLDLIRAGVVSAREHGAVGDGAADDTAAIQAAIDATPVEGVLLIPAGRYRLSTVNINKSITVMGHGHGQTMLIPIANADVIRINVGGGAPVFGGTLRDIGIFPVANRSAGAALHVGWIGGWRFDGIHIGNGLGGRPFEGIRIDSASDCSWYQTEANGCASHGIVLQPWSASSVIVEMVFDDQCRFSGNLGSGAFLTSTFASPAASLGGIHFNGVTFFGNAGSGVSIKPNHASAVIVNIHLQHAILDTNTLSGLKVEASSVGRVLQLMLDTIWAATNGESGVNLLYPVEGWRITNGFVNNNQHRGIYVDMDAVDNNGLIANCSFSNNSQAASLTYYAIDLADATGVTVVGNRVYNVPIIANQQHGLQIGAATRKIDIISNYLATGGVSTPYSNLAGHTGFDIRFGPNILGWDDDWFMQRAITFDESGWVSGTEPAAPPANQATVYTRDNGAGKTQLVARFATGAVQVIATQP